MPSVVVGGAVANKPLNGGEAWVRLSWVLGLARLGCDAYFVEQIDPASSVDREGRQVDFDASTNKRYFDAVMREFGLERSSALLLEGSERTSGMAYDDVLELAASADLLVNVSGHLSAEPLMSRFRRKAYVDLDPGFTQFWHASGVPGARLEGHDWFFTVGENIGRPSCTVPTGEIDWLPVRPPVVLEEWPRAGALDARRFTTIATWRSGFGTVEHEGRSYGLKVHEFRKVLDLPRRARASFEIALDIHPGDSRDLEALREHGWQIVDPRQVAVTPDAFRAYVQGSEAEFSVAQGVYVDTRCGWFSDRTVRYLASGRPALVQETGFSDNYPTGEGLLSFETPDEAVAGAEEIESRYEEHSAAARALAERYFDSDAVLGPFLERVEVS